MDSPRSISPDTKVYQPLTQVEKIELEETQETHFPVDSKIAEAKNQILTTTTTQTMEQKPLPENRTVTLVNTTAQTSTQSAVLEAAKKMPRPSKPAPPIPGSQTTAQERLSDSLSLSTSRKSIYTQAAVNEFKSRYKEFILSRAQSSGDDHEMINELSQTTQLLLAADPKSEGLIQHLREIGGLAKMHTGLIKDPIFEQVVSTISKQLETKRNSITTEKLTPLKKEPLVEVEDFISDYTNFIQSSSQSKQNGEMIGKLNETVEKLLTLEPQPEGFVKNLSDLSGCVKIHLHLLGKSNSPEKQTLSTLSEKLDERKNSIVQTKLKSIQPEPLEKQTIIMTAGKITPSADPLSTEREFGPLDELLKNEENFHNNMKEAVDRMEILANIATTLQEDYGEKSYGKDKEIFKKAVEVFKKLSLTSEALVAKLHGGLITMGQEQGSSSPSIVEKGLMGNIDSIDTVVTSREFHNQFKYITQATLLKNELCNSIQKFEADKIKYIFTDSSGKEVQQTPLQMFNATLKKLFPNISLMEGNESSIVAATQQGPRYELLIRDALKDARKANREAEANSLETVLSHLTPQLEKMNAKLPKNQALKS